MLTLRQTTPRLSFVAQPVANGVRVGGFITIPDMAFWLVVAGVLIVKQVSRDAGETWGGFVNLCGDIYTAGWVAGWVVRAAVTPLERGR